MQVEISEEAAKKALIEFVHKDADLDALAQLYSDLISDDTICVRGDDNGACSIKYLHGSHKAALGSESIDSIHFSGRTQRCLKAMGAKTLSDLTHRTARELLERPNFGSISLNEIRIVLLKRHLFLKNEGPGIEVCDHAEA